MRPFVSSIRHRWRLRQENDKLIKFHSIVISTAFRYWTGLTNETREKKNDEFESERFMFEIWTVNCGSSADILQIISFVGVQRSVSENKL